MSDVTPELVIEAYRRGLFPMAESRDADTLYWFDPERRGILPLDAFHVSRGLCRRIRGAPFVIRVNRAFAEVMRGCADPASGRRETWINDEILDLYGALHEAGLAHSVECWEGETLVGGIYGVALGAAFFGESMFGRRPDASKIALVHLAARLRVGGFRLFDVQYVTDHLRRFGAIEIDRDDYRARLAAALAAPADFYRAPEDAAPVSVLQSITQTS
ncbi:MAG: leucyl/phenylalanyl-tRNA--protein transferase [Alphaproteobacteria bacterium]